MAPRLLPCSVEVVSDAMECWDTARNRSAPAHSRFFNYCEARNVSDLSMGPPSDRRKGSGDPHRRLQWSSPHRLSAFRV